MAFSTLTAEWALASQGSGSGSNNSGHGSGSDDDNGDDNNSGSGNQGSGRDKKEREDLIQAVASGKAVGIKQLLRYVHEKHPGTILDLRFRQSGGRFIYQVKLLTEANRVQKLKLDAKTLQLLR